MASLNINTSAEILDKQESSTELEFTNIEGTPFTIVKQNGLYYGLIGNHRITESYLLKEVLEKEITEITWDRILQVVWAVTEKFKMNKEQIEQLEVNQ